MGELIALIAAACFGLNDFVSGLLARTAAGMTVSLYGQFGGVALSVLMALWWPASGTSDPASWGWAALSGLGTGVGVAFLFRAAGAGAMSVVVPVSALGGAALPVVFGLLLLDERPTPLALTGIALALPAIWLVSRSPKDVPGTVPGVGAAGVPDAVISGIGFAVQFVAMARVDLGAGLWPLALSRVSSVVIIALLIARTAAPWTLPRRSGFIATVSGMVGTAGIICFLFATRQQMLTTATVLAALYPAIPVVLGLTVLRERLNLPQSAGLAGAGAAALLLAL
jgi:drug/metabolite transporter (DMT)-like permease